MGWKSVSPAAKANFPLYRESASWSTDVGSSSAEMRLGL